MNGMLIALIILSAILYLIFALYFDNKLYKFIWKPGTMILIILLAIIESGLSTVFSYWVLVALLFSVMGDILLMLHKKWFIYGLGSFLIAHILYITGFLVAFSFTFSASGLFLIIVLTIIAGVFYCFLFQNVRKEGGRRLLFAVACYMVVITTMLSLAIMTGITIFIVAALVFFISDSILAVNRFKVKFQLADYLVMSTYFTAQLLFAISLGGL